MSIDFRKPSQLKKIRINNALVWSDDSGGGGSGEKYNTFTGSVVTFETIKSKPIRSLTTSFSPKQDLHGYDSPWPSGGGINKWDFAHPVSTYNASVTENADGTFSVVGTSAGATLSYLVSVKPNQIYSIKLTSSNESGNTAIFGYGFVYDGHNNTAPALIDNKLFLSGKTFTPTGDTVFVVFKVTGGSGSGSATASVPIINEGSTPATYAPYSNICPISGRTSAAVTRAGKNLANDAEFSIEEPSWSTAEYWLGLSKNADGTFTLTRPIGWGGNGFVYVGTYKAGTYKLSFDLISTADVNCGATCAIKKKGTWTAEGTVAAISGLTVAGRYSLNDLTITEDCDVWLAVGPYTDNGAQVISGNYQLEVGSTASAYETYAGNTYTIQLGQTVYGGTLDVTAGKMTVTKAEVDLGTLDWVYSYGRPNAPLVGIKPSANGSSKVDLVCTAYKNLTPNEWYAQNTPGITSLLTGYIGNDIIGLCDPNYTDAQALKTALSGVRLVYELATPFEITLTPTQITTLLGTNNIWADTGNIEVVAYSKEVS